MVELVLHQLFHSLAVEHGSVFPQLEREEANCPASFLPLMRRP
jgi:hypothetical protein